MLLEHSGVVTLTVDDRSVDAVALAHGLSDVFARSGWRVIRRAAELPGKRGVSLLYADPFKLSEAEVAIIFAWRKAEMGPLQRGLGEPTTAPEFEIADFAPPGKTRASRPGEAPPQGRPAWANDQAAISS